MPASPPAHIDNSLLKMAMREHLPERIEHFGEVWQVICRYGWDRPILRKLRQGVQDLRTTAHGFSFSLVSERLLSLDVCLQRIGQDPGPLDPLLTAEVSYLLEEIKTAIQETVVSRSFSHKKVTKDLLLCTAQWHNKRHIFCLSQDQVLFATLAKKCQEQVYHLHIFTDMESLLGAIDPMIPAALFLDLQLTPNLSAVGEKLHNIKELRQFRVAQIFLSLSGDLTDRLGALRAGGDAFFSAPWNVTAMVSKLDELVQPQALTAYRVLVVDDDPTQAQFTASILHKAGMQAQRVTEALQVMEALADFVPDLILMDLYMPDANGMELTTIIREHNDFSQIPIVFLSGENDTRVQMDALTAGGEAFLAKPIRPRRLISSVKEVIQRTRGRRKQTPS